MPDMQLVVSHISDDLPIHKMEEDHLNRGNFANALATIIGSWRNKPSLVVGLFGDWGSGKSSLKNLVIESLQNDPSKSPRIVEFSPWQVSGQDLLTETFFSEIGRVLQQEIPASETRCEQNKTAWTKIKQKIFRKKVSNISPQAAEAKRRVARWKLYANFLTISGNVAHVAQLAAPAGSQTSIFATGAALAAESAASVAKCGAETLDANATANECTLSELKEQIDNDLRTLPRPILVVLDDIDRLTKDEIRHMLQLIKANTDFPNLIYLLLAQKKSVLKALEEISPDDPQAFLEKIVQVNFDLPVINRKQLEEPFYKGLNELLAGPALEKDFSKDYWQIVLPNLLKLFHNLREVKRFLGTLAFHIELFRKGDTFEVNPVDLIVIEAIRLFEPDVYRRIPDAKEVLTLLPRFQLKEAPEEDHRRVQELVNLSSPERKEIIQSLLGAIFPPSRLAGGLNSRSGEVENGYFQQLRVCSYQAFDKYFQFATPEGDVSQAEIDFIVQNMGNITELDRIFARLVKRDLLDVMLARLAALKETLPLENAVTFLTALYQIKPRKRYYGFYELSPKARATNITYWYLQRLPENKRLEVMEKVLKRTLGLAFAIDTVATLTRAFEPGQNLLSFFEKQESRDHLNQAALEAILRATSPDSKVELNDVIDAVGFWARFDKPAATAWLDVHLNSRSALVHFLEPRITNQEGTDGRHQFLFVVSFEDLISIEHLEQKFEQHLNGVLTDDEARLVRLFRQGVQFRREGKDDPHSVWDNAEKID